MDLWKRQERGSTLYSKVNLKGALQNWEECSGQVCSFFFFFFLPLLAIGRVEFQDAFYPGLVT